MSIFSPIQPSSRLSDKAIEQIKRLVDEGILKPGEKLPSERELAKQFSIARTSVREALHVLEALRVIEIRPGEGTYVTDLATINMALSSRWNWLLAQEKEEILNFLEVREALEPKAAALATVRASDEDIQHIDDALQKMEEGVKSTDIALMVSGDIEFHDQISKATKNQILIDLNQLINRLLQETRYAFFDVPGAALESCQQHRTVFEAIRSRNSDAAAKAMLHHVQMARARISEFIEQPELKETVVPESAPSAAGALGDLARSS